MKCLELAGRKAEREQLGGGVRREGQENMTALVIPSPVSSYDGWLGRGRRNRVYLKRAIKKICLSRGKKAVPILVVDVSDEAGLIHLQTDTAALMWLKIAALLAQTGLRQRAPPHPRAGECGLSPLTRNHFYLVSFKVVESLPSIVC